MSAVQVITVPWVVDSLKAFIGTYVQTQIPHCGPDQNVTVEFCVNPEELPISPPINGMYVSFGAKVWPPAGWVVTDIVVDLALVDRQVFQPVTLTKWPKTDTWLAKEFLDFWRIVSDRYAINRFNCSVILVYITLKHAHLVHGFQDHRQTLGRMLDDALWTDFEVRVAGEKLLVHRAILAARSQVFAAMLDSNMKERNCSFLEIVDFDPPVVKAMLRYIYTGEFNSESELVWDLILISDKYGLNRLKENCERVLKNLICEENLGRILLLSDQISSSSLKGQAIEELVQIGPKFLDTEEWKLMETSHSKLANELLKTVWIKIQNTHS